MSTTTAPAKRAAAGPASTCQSTVAPSDQPTPIAPSRSSASASSATSAAIRSTVGALAVRGAGCAVAAQVDGDDPEIVGERVLRAEEAAMRHQPVQQHERAALRLPSR